MEPEFDTDHIHLKSLTKYYAAKIVLFCAYLRFSADALNGVFSKNMLLLILIFNNSELKQKSWYFISQRQ